MVKVIDGFKEGEEIRRGKDLVYRIAASIFSTKRVRIKRPEDITIIFDAHGVGKVAEACYRPNVISVFREKNYGDCLRLAEGCEKALSEDFVLRTEYKRL